MAVTLNVIQNGIGGHVGQRVGTAELGVKIQGIFRDDFLLAVDLIIDIAGGSTLIFNFHPETGAVRHFKIAIHASGGIGAHGTNRWPY